MYAGTFLSQKFPRVTKFGYAVGTAGRCVEEGKLWEVERLCKARGGCAGAGD